MKPERFRPRVTPVMARQWLAHGDDHEVRPLTTWEKFTTKKHYHSTSDVGMLVVGTIKLVVAPGDWIIHENDRVWVLSNDDFIASYVPVSLDPTLQELVDQVEQSKEDLTNRGLLEEVTLFDQMTSALYLQAELIAKCYAERYQYDTRFLPRKSHA